MPVAVEKSRDFGIPSINIGMNIRGRDLFALITPEKQGVKYRAQIKM